MKLKEEWKEKLMAREIKSKRSKKGEKKTAKVKIREIMKFEDWKKER
jgi:hypothetical protein